MTEELKGQPLPEVTLPVSTGGEMQLPEDLKNAWTILYFYPKDDTPGCTKQACAYRDHIQEFKNLGAQVIGVSLDDIDSHHQFIENHSLNFPLLSDPDHKLSESLEVYQNGGLSRDTFLIDPQGNIKEVWRNVSPKTTYSETLETLQSYLNQ